MEDLETGLDLEFGGVGLEMYSGFRGPPGPFRGPSGGIDPFGGPRFDRNPSGGINPYPSPGSGFGVSRIGGPSSPNLTTIYDLPGSRAQVHFHGDQVGNLTCGKVYPYERNAGSTFLNPSEAIQTEAVLQSLGFKPAKRLYNWEQAWKETLTEIQPLVKKWI